MAHIAILIGIEVGLAVVSSFLQPGAPKQQPIDRGKQDDLRFTIVEEGAFIPRVYGTRVRLGGNIFWGTPTQEHRTTTPGSSGGKKGRGAEPPTNTFSYDKSLAVYFCEGPIRAFLKVTEGDIVLFNQFALDPSAYYEAEASANTLAGGATRVEDDSLLSGAKVTLPPGGSVLFPNVRGYVARTLDLGIYFQSDAVTPVTVRVNNTTNYTPSLVDSDGDLAATDVAIAVLESDNNTIKITNNHATESLHLDRIFVFPFFPENDDVTGIVDVDLGYPGDADDPSLFYNKPLRMSPAGNMSGTSAAAGQAQLEFLLGTETQDPPDTIVTAEGVDNTPGFRGLAGFVSKDHQVQNGQLGNITAELEPLLSDLADIIAAEFKLRGATDDDLELSALEGITVEGLYIDKLAPLGETLDALKFFYNFDLVPADGQIKAVLRGGASVRTIPFHELLAHNEGEEAPAGIRIQHIEAADLPGGVYVAWVNPNDAKDFHNATQFVPLNSDGPSLEAETINLPLVVSDSDEIIAAGKRWLFLQHLINHPLEFNLDPKHRDLIPTDIVTLELPQKTIDVSITSKQADLPGLVKTKAVPENSGLYNQNGIGQIGTGTETPKVRFPANTCLAMLDIPLLADEDDRLRWKAAVCPRGTGNWQGARVHKETLADSDEYHPLLAFPHPSTIGVLDDDVDPVTDTLAIDRVTEIVVNLFYDQGELASVSEDDILARPVNQFAIGSGFGAEICRAATVTPQAPVAPYVASYVLTDILHGLYGTEAAALAGHDAGKTVVLLNDAVLTWTEDPAELQRERNLVAVTVGQALPDALALGPTAFSFLGFSKKPYSVADIRRLTTEDGAAIVDWIRRIRINGQLQNLTGPPLNEESERYLTEFLSDDELTVLHQIWVENSGTVPVPWYAYVDPSQPTLDLQRSGITLDPYHSFFEGIIASDDAAGGIAGHNIEVAFWNADYSRQIWKVAALGDAANGWIDVQIFEYDDSGTVGSYSAHLPVDQLSFRVRLQIQNGEAVFFVDYLNNASVPVYRARRRPPEIGPIRLSNFQYVGGSYSLPLLSNTVVSNGAGRRVILSPELQEHFYGGLKAEGTMHVRITQYSALVGPGYATTAIV